jgi:hypothetical protein
VVLGIEPTREASTVRRLQYKSKGDILPNICEIFIREIKEIKKNQGKLTPPFSS